MIEYANKPNLLVLIGLIFLVLALPVRNYLEVLRFKKKEKKWANWLTDLPSKDQYRLLHHQNSNDTGCDYCDSIRQYPSLEMVMHGEIRFGFINNTFNKTALFKSYICTRCGSELYRERTVE